MAAFSPFHLVMADGWSATSAPACLTSAGNFCLKYCSGPVGQPIGGGVGAEACWAGRPAAWSSEHRDVGHARVGGQHRLAVAVLEGEPADRGEVLLDDLLGGLLVRARPGSRRRRSRRRSLRPLIPPVELT